MGSSNVQETKVEESQEPMVLKEREPADHLLGAEAEEEMTEMSAFAISSPTAIRITAPPTW